MDVDWILHFKDLSIAIAALTTSVGAVVGYTQWRKELTGNARFKVANDLLKATYILRDEIKAFRSKIFLSVEDGREIDDLIKRWSQIVDAEKKFNAQKIEAECFWGTEIVTTADKLTECVNDLDSAVSAKIADIQSGGENFKFDKRFAKKTKWTLFRDLDEQDELNKKIDAAVKSIKDKLELYV